MKLRYLLLATAFFVSPAVCAQADAATLNPESDWAVTKVAAKDPSSAPYCALARKFTNNVIMTIARNTRDETSVAVDFQQALFNKNENVNISLGNGRDFLLPPVSNKAVVARIGADAAFFDDLQKNAGLDMGIMGQIYSFRMPDVAVANTQLTTCLMAMGNASAPTSPAQDADMDNKIAALQDQISTLKTQRESMAQKQDAQTNNSQLMAASGGGANADLAQKIADLQAQNMSLRNRVDTERSNFDTLQTKSLEDKSRLALLEETQDQLIRAQQDTQKFRSQLSDAQTKQDSLITKLEQYSDSEAKRKQLENHLAQVQAEHAQLMRDLSAEKEKMELVQAAQDAVMNQQKEELDKTKAQLAVKSQELDVKQEELSLKAQELTKTNKELSQAAQQRDNYKSRLQEFSGIRDRLATLAEEQKALGANVTTLKSEKTELTGKLEAERSRLNDIQNEKAALEKQVNATTEEKAKLEKLLDEERAKQAEVALLEKDLSSLQEKQKELATRVDSLQDEKKGLQTRVTDLEGRVKTAEEDKAKLAADLDKAKVEQEKTAQSLSAIEEEKKKIASDLNLTKEEKEKIAADLDKARMEQEKTAQSLNAIEEEKKKIATDLSLTKEEKEKIAANLDKAKAEHEKMAQNLKTIEDENKKLAADLNLSKDAKQKIVTDLDRIQAEQARIAQNISGLENEKQQLVAERDKARAEKQDLVVALDEADAVMSAQGSKIDGLTIKQKGLLSQVASLEGEKKELLAQLDNQKTQLAQLETASKNDRDFKYDFEKIKREMAELSKERDDLRKALQQAKADNLQLAAAQTHMDDDARQLFTQAEELEYQRVDLNSALEFERQMNNVTPASGNDTTLGEMKASLAAIQAERDEFRRLLDIERTRSAELKDLAGDPANKQTLAELSGQVKKLQADNVNLLRELEYEKSKAGDKGTVVATAATGDEKLTIMRLRDEVKQLQARSGGLEKEQSTLLAQVRTLEAEKQKLAQTPAPVAPQNTAETEQMKTQVAALQAEKASLTQSLAAAQQAKAQQPQPAAPNPQQVAAAEAANREIAALKSQLAQAQALITAREAQVAAPPPVPVAPTPAPVQVAAAPAVAAPVAGAVSLPPASPAPVVTPAPAPAQVAKPIVSAPEPMEAVAAAAPRNVDVESQLRQLLQSSGMGTPSQFGPVTIPVASNVQAWRWKMGALTGNAESHPAPDAATQNDVIQQFLAKARTRCPGDFALIENSRTQTASGLVVSADIACVAGANGVAAAIAFVQFGDRMVTIAHEADTAGIPNAMMARDKIIQAAMK